MDHCMQSIPLAVLKHVVCPSLFLGEVDCMQSIPLAVLKRVEIDVLWRNALKLHAIHTACGIETVTTRATARDYTNCMQSIPLAVLKQFHPIVFATNIANCMQSIPLAVLKLILQSCDRYCVLHCMQSIPLAVLKLAPHALRDEDDLLHAIHTACGIETYRAAQADTSDQIACNPYRLRY